ncbi:hypothetical protein HETIRDRAFT_103285 [Heterobasidion irregulare TC 32-1]|uniref:Uncharacterized protein n=1 Tax=Heterobasidion irregulare (strain TC 32-1) TaxID=747525 RepID=W4KG44_HETIT|nr:uncharacterized protein HETIRDRAFT_103285 [Heterobasidion irregulare TC 32-1]ETW84792.1 hypothetical protein HETIRDRAFT_103285 [Heterobasidion irregulare TC 32-1]
MPANSNGAPLTIQLQVPPAMLLHGKISSPLRVDFRKGSKGSLSSDVIRFAKASSSNALTNAPAAIIGSGSGFGSGPGLAHPDPVTDEYA